MPKEIPLSQGKVALVDDEDFDFLMQWKWSYDCGYATRKVQSKNKKTKIYMHRLILGITDKSNTDHIDSNTLNNRKHNLRKCTRLQNSANMKKYRGTSIYKGVCWLKKDRRWFASIMVNYKQIRLGYFINEIDAARAYDAAAIKYFGAFAKLNFPECIEEKERVPIEQS